MILPNTECETNAKLQQRPPRAVVVPGRACRREV